jgi:membrane-bound serine protease (ClpP class)
MTGILTSRRLLALLCLTSSLALFSTPLQGQSNEDDRRGALLLQVQLPIELQSIDDLVQSVDHAVEQLQKMRATAENGQRPYLILRFINNADRSSAYEACNVLAERLAQSDVTTACETVALLSGSIQDHVLLVALALQQIYIAPATTLGPIANSKSDQQTPSQAMLDDYLRFTAANQLLPKAIVLGLLDPAEGVYKLTTEQGITYATQQERDDLSQSAGFTKEQTLSEPGSPFALSANQLDNSINTRVLEQSDAALKAKLNIATDLFFKGATTVGKIRPAVVDLVSPSTAGHLTAADINEKTKLVKQLAESGHNWIGFNIDCSGGDYTSILELCNTIAELNQRGRDVRTVAFIQNQALESAALIALACDEIFLSQQALIGGPGNQPLSADELIDILPPLKKISEDKHRTWSIFATMIDPSLPIHVYRHRLTGVEQIFCHDQYNQQTELENWQKQTLIDGSDGFTQNEVQQLGLTNQPLASMAEVLDHFGLNPTLEPISKRPWIAAIERFAMNPWFASVMLTIGMYGLFIEMGTPGLSIPGIVALLCFALFLWSKELNGTINALEVVLIVVGVLCLAVEIFIIPGFGVFGFSGLGLIFIGLVLASQTFVIPQNNFQIDSMVDSVATVIFSVLGVIALYIGLTRTLSDTRFGNMLAPARSDQQQQADTQWTESLVHWDHLLGCQGVTVTPLSPAGKVQIEGAVYDVISDGKHVDSGSSIKVVEVTGSRMVVSTDIS